MKKKYYFWSTKESLLKLLPVLIFGPLIIPFFYADEIPPLAIAGLCLLIFIVVSVPFRVGFLLSSRIQIDYGRKELYIRYDSLIRKIKFEDIVSIEIIDLNEFAFRFVLNTKTFSKKIVYARYISNKKLTPEITAKLSEIKQDLANISNKNY